MKYELSKAKHEIEVNVKEIRAKDSQLDKQEHTIKELKQEVFTSDVTIRKLTKIDFLKEEITTMKEEIAKNKAENAERDAERDAAIAKKDAERDAERDIERDAAIEKDAVIAEKEAENAKNLAVIQEMNV